MNLSANLNNAPEPARSRIVVPFDRQRPEVSRSRPVTPARKSRAGKVIAIIAALLVGMILCVATGVFFWWRHYQTTPAYSLALLVDAAQHDDMNAVDKIVDTDKIVDNLASQLIDKAAGGFGIALTGTLRKQIEARLPAALPVVKQTVRGAIADRVKEISESADRKPFIVVALAVPYLVKIDTDGDAAKVTGTVRDQQLDLDLKRGTDGWRVVAIHDDALVQRMIDQVIRDLPALGSGALPDIHSRRAPAVRIP